jgi:hypothetical protein
MSSEIGYTSVMRVSFIVAKVDKIESGKEMGKIEIKNNSKININYFMVD